MMRVIAAVDGGAATAPVLATAIAAGRLLGAEVEALHVRSDGDEPAAREAARAAGTRLTVLDGPRLTTLAQAVVARDAGMVVAGARPLRGQEAAEQLGVELATAVNVPTMLVPADAAHAGRLRRVLIPLQGATAWSWMPRRMLALVTPAELDVVAARVLDSDSIPSFSDQPQHQTAAWAQEFLARYASLGPESISVALRVGDLVDAVLQLADELDPDLVALAWNEHLVPGSVMLLRALLSRATVPVLLDPVTADVGS
jgi:hypothetical protein